MTENEPQAGLPPDSVYPFYTGIYLPAKTPLSIVGKLHDEIAKALVTPAVKERLAGLGIEPTPMTAEPPHATRPSTATRPSRWTASSITASWIPGRRRIR